MGSCKFGRRLLKHAFVKLWVSDLAWTAHALKLTTRIKSLSDGHSSAAAIDSRMYSVENGAILIKLISYVQNPSSSFKIAKSVTSYISSWKKTILGRRVRAYIGCNYFLGRRRSQGQFSCKNFPEGFWTMTRLLWLHATSWELVCNKLSVEWRRRRLEPFDCFSGDKHRHRHEPWSSRDRKFETSTELVIMYLLCTLTDVETVIVGWRNETSSVRRCVSLRQSASPGSNESIINGIQSFRRLPVVFKQFVSCGSTSDMHVRFWSRMKEKWSKMFKEETLQAGSYSGLRYNGIVTELHCKQPLYESWWNFFSKV